MATKPATTPEIWASNAVYTTGPFIGSPSVVAPAPAVAAEGDRPGALFPTAAEHKNFQSFWETTWITSWLSLGSSAGAADAHIVETAADGRFQVEGADVIPSNANPYALFVQAPPGAGNAIQATGASAFGDATILGITTGLGAAVEARSATAGPGFYATHSGTGEGIVVVHTGAGTAGVFSNSSTGLALDVIGSDSIQAANFQGGVGQAAIVAVSGVNATTAIGALGDGTATGVDAVGGSGGAAATGARGTAAHADAAGLVGRSAAAASTSGRGVYAEGRGSAAALEAVASANYAAIIQGEIVAPTYGAIRVVSQNARPTNINGGSLTYLGGEGQWAHSQFDDFGQPGPGEGWRGILSTIGGSAFAYASRTAPFFIPAVDNAYYTVLTITADAGNAPKMAGRSVLMRINMTPQASTAATATTFKYRLVDVTAGGVTIYQRAGIGGAADSGVYIPATAAAAWLPAHSFMVTVGIPATGTRTWTLDVGHDGPGSFSVRDLSAEFLGMT